MLLDIERWYIRYQVELLDLSARYVEPFSIYYLFRQSTIYVGSSPSPIHRISHFSI